MENSSATGSAQTATAPIATTHNPPGPANATQEMVSLSGGSISTDQARSLMQHAVDAGRCDLATANKYLQSEGHLPLGGKPARENAFNESFDANFSAPKTSNEYYLPGLRGDGTKETDARNNLVRGTLHAAGLSRELGESFVRLSDDTAKRLSQMNPDQRESWAKSQRTQLDSIWKDKAPEKLAAVNSFIDSLEGKVKGSTNYLRTNDSIWSAQSILMIANHLERQAVRGAK